MLSLLNPSVGKLLISEPFLPDPNFRRSVVLLSEFSAEGVMGFILNQPSNLMLKDLLLECPNADFPVFIGGPVEVDTIHFVHRCFDRMQEGEEIAEGLYWGGDFDKLQHLIETNRVLPHEVKFFLGYSGWDMQQLEGEIAQNVWIVSDTYHAETIFSNDEEELWKEVIINLGPKYAHISNFPIDPNLN
jgi:putative transcriptional regulator